MSIELAFPAPQSSRSCPLIAEMLLRQQTGLTTWLL